MGWTTLEANCIQTFMYHMAKKSLQIFVANPLGPSIMAILGLTAIMERKKSEEEEYKGVLEAKLRLSCHSPFLLLAQDLPPTPQPYPCYLPRPEQLN